MSIKPNIHHQYLHLAQQRLPMVPHMKENSAQIHRNTTPLNSAYLGMGIGAPKHFLQNCHGRTCKPSMT